MKPLYFPDEHGLRWTLWPTDKAFGEVRAAKLHEGDFACWRDRTASGFFTDRAAELARERLDDITRQCLAAEAPDDVLLGRLEHAAKAFVTTSIIRARIETES